jgi:hypothetical protein
MDFENLKVYQKARMFYHEIQENVLDIAQIDKSTKDQLRRAASSSCIRLI